MPGGNRTGPQGFGPMTGRAAGYCAGFDEPGYVDAGAWPAYGGGRRWGGRRRGRRSRHMYYATGRPRWARWAAGPAWGQAPMVGSYAQPIPREQRAQALEEQATLLREELADLEQAIAELRDEKASQDE